MSSTTKTGGRDATKGVIPGQVALSVGNPGLPEPEGYAWRPLSSLARLESGHTPARSRPEYWGGNVPWVGIRDATGNHGHVIHETLDSVTQEGLDNSSARLLPVNTVCLSRTASVGYVIQMGRPMATSQDFVNWVCGPDLNPAYLRYVLMLEQRSIRERFARGSTHQTMYYPEAKALYVMVPGRWEQDAISEVLSSLDEKCLANESVARKLDYLRHVSISAVAGGGRDRPLSELARFVNGRPFTKDATGRGRVVIRIAELKSGLGSSTVYNDIEVADEHLARPGDLLFAWSGSLTVARWYREEAIVNQHIFKVLPKSEFPAWLVDHALRAKLADFQGVAADKATTMGHIQRRHLDELVRVPSNDLVRSLDASMAALWNRALAAEKESLTLIRTRDELLPLLILGKIRVKDAEKVVEEVL